MKNLEERFESLEKTVRIYRILVVLLIVLLFVLQRRTIVGWIDRMETWASAVSSAGA
jgi:hypothetical protein